MIRKFSNFVLCAFFSILVLSVVFTAFPSSADSMSDTKGGMMKTKGMMDDKTMTEEPDSMMATTAQMMDDKPMMEGSDSMMADTGQMMESGSGEKMK